MSQRHIAVGSYLTLLLLQPVWHVVLPPPLGSASAVLAMLATLPLLLPLKGVLQGRPRSMTLAGYLVVLYFVIGIMEAWSNAPQRAAALFQVLLSVVYIGSLVLFVRQRRG